MLDFTDKSASELRGEKERPEFARPYKPVDVIAETVKSGAGMGLGGLAYAAVQNALTKENIGAKGVFTRYGNHVVTFTAVGASYALVHLGTANLREKEDSWNAVLGGLVSGAFLGTRGRTMTAVVGYSALCGAAVGTYDYAGRLRGFSKDSSEDDDAKAEAVRRSRRRPIEETIQELGEIRGIKAPGFAERRRERLKEKYGIEVTNDE